MDRPFPTCQVFALFLSNQAPVESKTIGSTLLPTIADSRKSAPYTTCHSQQLCSIELLATIYVQLSTHPWEPEACPQLVEGINEPHGEVIVGLLPSDRSACRSRASVSSPQTFSASFGPARSPPCSLPPDSSPSSPPATPPAPAPSTNP